jgi:hypothetical protein
VVLLALTAVAVLWPAWVGWPFAALCGWFALNLGIRGWRLQRRHRREVREAKPGCALAARETFLLIRLPSGCFLTTSS